MKIHNMMQWKIVIKRDGCCFHCEELAPGLGRLAINNAFERACQRFPFERVELWSNSKYRHDTRVRRVRRQRRLP